jgi:hypothetical protein
MDERATVYDAASGKEDPVTRRAVVAISSRKLLGKAAP